MKSFKNFTLEHIFVFFKALFSECLLSIKDPALESLDYKVSIARGERVVPEGRAGLRPAVTKVGVQPETELSLPGSNSQTVCSAPE